MITHNRTKRFEVSMRYLRDAYMLRGLLVGNAWLISQIGNRIAEHGPSHFM